MSNEPTRRIVLVGAPGSGKTNLAKVLRVTLNPELKVIDEYVENLAIESDLALGYTADLIPNIMVASHRLAQETRIKDNYILCGSLINTYAYVALWAADLAEFYQRDQQAFSNFIRRVGTAMDMLTLFMMETWNYSHVFYLPLPQDHESEFDRRLDHSIQEAFAILGVDHIILDGDDRLTQAVEAIEGKVDDEPADAPE